MKLYLFLFVACFAVAGRAADLEMIALRTLSDDPLALFVADDKGERVGTTVGISIEAVRAITNRADVLALAAEFDNTPSQILPNLIVADDAEIIFGRWQYAQDPDTGELIPLGPVHGSPWLSKAERAALKTTAVANHKAAKAADKVLLNAIGKDSKLDKSTKDAAASAAAAITAQDDAKKPKKAK